MTRRALLLVSSRYTDSGLPTLAVEGEVQEFASVFGDPRIGGFEVQALVNPSASEAMRAVEAHFAAAGPADTVLFYFNGHSMKNVDGELLFATRDTVPSTLDSTSLSSAFVQRQMDRCRAQRQVTILDCPYSGAFGRGMT